MTENSKVNWSSADTKIASVGNSENIKGLVYGVSTGNTSISASGTINGLSYTSSANITISDAVITDLQVTPPESSITERLTKQYTATARFSDGTTEDVTNNKYLYWSSDNTSVATISSSQVIDNGIATGIKAGVATITASGNINNRQFNATSLLSVTESVTIPNVGTFSKPDNILRNWQDASNYCASPGIIGNWRLPTNAEIIALINYGGSQGTDSWLGTILGWNTSLAWSSTLNSANGKHYSVLLRNGITDDSNIDAATLLVTCIRN
ncbi:Ig-like domain-containing protein [Aeromonas veronii]